MYNLDPYYYHLSEHDMSSAYDNDDDDEYYDRDLEELNTVEKYG